MVSKPAQGFDLGSGQIYTERTCKAGPTISTWVWKTRGTSNGFMHFNNDGPGCSLLQAMCVRYFLSDTFNITNSAIETLPVHLASQIWLEIKKSQLDSLRVWKIFVSAFGNQLGKSLIHKRVILRDPPSDLSECISHIVSPRFDWVTFLTLAHVPFSRTDVIQVARLTNLGKLSLGPHSNGDIGLDDSIVRAWSRAASEAKAFTKLRILTCRSHVNITGQIFAYFQEFPALGLICVDNPNASSAFKDQAEEYCWFLMKDEVLRESAFAAHASTWQQVYDNCFEDGVFKPENLEKGSGRNGGVQPTLDLTLGLRHDRYCMRVILYRIGSERLAIGEKLKFDFPKSV